MSMRPYHGPGFYLGVNHVANAGRGLNVQAAIEYQGGQPPASIPASTPTRTPAAASAVPPETDELSPGHIYAARADACQGAAGAKPMPATLDPLDPDQVYAVRAAACASQTQPPPDEGDILSPGAASAIYAMREGAAT